jgi:UDP-glucose 4-epimerase
MRILVTGGAGFIASHVVDACLAAGHDVAVVDDLSAGSLVRVPRRARLYRLDVGSAELDDVFDRERPELVSHHAAQVSVRRSREEPLLDAQVNVVGSINVLEAARRHRVRRVVFASSGAVYGEVDGAADEAHPCRPCSPYAVAKLAVEHYLQGYHATGGLESVVLRYANVYGPRQDPHGEAGVVAVFIQRILAGLTPVIHGDGQQVRDFVAVEDVVRANLAAHALAIPPGPPVVVNVGTGGGTSIQALWQTLAAIARPGVRPYHEPRRAGDVRCSVVDPGRARAVLGWCAAVSLEAGLRRTWEWFLAHADPEHQPEGATV